MKIPQREDSVRLGAPQTQAGRAVQPVEGSLGDSYIKTMQGLSKQFDEISKMQFQLSENAVKGQLNAFDIYVDSRTKQYDKDIQLATSKEQIDGLYAQYRKDIAENGNKVLGNNLYDNWERVKGGTTLANAEYAGAVANTVLLNKQNKELAITSLDALNLEAGNAETPEKQKEYREKAYALLKSEVENGTFDAATAEKLRRKFDYDLDRTQIERDVFANPAATLDLLKTDSYAPEVTYPERQMFISNAEKMIAKQSGTSNDDVVKKAEEAWLNLRFDDNPNTKNNSLQMAGVVYDWFENEPKKARKWVSSITGTPESNLTLVEMENVLSKITAVVNRQNQDLVFEYDQIFDANLSTRNSLITIEEKKKTDGKKTVTYKVLDGEEALRAFEAGKLTKSLSKDSQIFDVFTGFSSLFTTPKFNMYATQNRAAFKKVNDELNEMATFYIKGIRKGDKLIEAEEKWEQNMRASFIQMMNELDKTAIPNPDEAMIKFTKNLWSSFGEDGKKYFDNKTKLDETTAGIVVDQTYSALRASGIPQEYIKFFFNNSCPMEIETRLSKFLQQKQKIYGYDITEMQWLNRGLSTND